jgi:integrase
MVNGVPVVAAPEEIDASRADWLGELLLQGHCCGHGTFVVDMTGHLHPERFWRTFKNTLTRCRRELGEDALPMITIHDLRHTHASLLLSAGEPVKTVSERLGHASATVTMTVYAHVLPGDQKRAASRFAALIGEA